MGRKRRSFTAEFKAEAVRLCKVGVCRSRSCPNRDLPEVVAQDLEISYQQVQVFRMAVEEHRA